jgi:peptidoglycan-associated lipoprotein
VDSTVSDTRASQFTPSAPPGSFPPASTSTDLSGLGDIFFDFDQYHIRKDAAAILHGNAAWLHRERGKSFLIEGHCDERGTIAYNLVLGEKRARATKRYLQELGIASSRIQITSYGEVRPFCKEHNEGCWQKNRRAHFVVL